MRAKLEKLDAQRDTFTGMFKKYGTKTGYRGPATETILLVNIRDKKGSFICDHLWFNLTKGFEKLGNLKEGDAIQFDARVGKYKKGYVNRKAGIDQTAVDYKLSHPTKLIKLVILLLLCLSSLSLPVHAQSGLQRLDEHILENLAAGRTDGQTEFWRFISNANLYVNVAIPAGVLMSGLIENDTRTKKNALYIASSTATTYLLNLVIKRLVKRPRPFLTDLRLVPVYRPGEYSFPSGHSSSAFSAVTALSRSYPKWYVIAPSFLWAASVGYSRMYLGVHYPTDVTSGAVLGAGTAFAMGFLRP